MRDARIAFAGWVDPAQPDSGPERPEERRFWVVVECPTADAFDGLTIGDVWDRTPVKVVRASPQPRSDKEGGE